MILNKEKDLQPIFSEKKVVSSTHLLQDKLKLLSEGKASYGNKIPKAIVRTGDIMVLLPVKERQAQRIMSRLRKTLGKTNRQFVTVREFSTQTGIDEWTIQRVLDMCT